ncbi:hypothetical protein AB834_03705 [PVC group bacterium (ex Bugula neritina AB1)]|nr:hypothetical protein AB834_03705 [PVC group bacterium (ex Bugula neritina AB1)]
MKKNNNISFPEFSKLTYAGFKNCVAYAATFFDSSFSKASKGSSKIDFAFGVPIKGFIQILDEFDITVFDKKPNSADLRVDFSNFRESMIKGDAPLFNLKFVDPRLAILSTLSPDNDLLIYCNILSKKSKLYKDFSIEDTFFYHLESKNKSFFFDAVRFVVLSSVSDVDCINQVHIIFDAYSKAVRDDTSDTRKIQIIAGFVIKIRIKFFDGADSCFYQVNQLFLKNFSDMKHDNFFRSFIGTPRNIDYLSEINPVNGRYVYGSVVSSYKTQIVFKRPARCFTRNSPQSFRLIRIYCEFLNKDFHQYICNRSLNNFRFPFFLSKDLQSCAVYANNVGSLTSFFDNALKNVRSLNTTIAFHMDPNFEVSCKFLNKPFPKYSSFVKNKGFIILL